MGETSESPIVTEEGELSNDGDTNDLFVVDSTPRVNENRIEIPVYNKKFNEVLQVQPKEDGNDKPKRAKPAQNKCWNCDGDHSLRDCTEPRNYEAINRNRQLFMSKSTPRGSKASRYHLDDQQKYPHVQPGRMSRRLRRALGLQSNQLPRHIYRMRILGYPPGWVEEARVSHSGLYLFNSDGQEVADPGFEDGEVVAAGAKDKFDTKKIIEYPGFNCPCGPDIIDETERLNSKPMAEKDSIERMMVVWQPKAVTAYKRRKMNAADSSGTPKPSDHAKKRSLLLLDDMEIESDGAGSSGDGEIDEEKKEDVQDTKPASPEAQKRSASPTSDLPSPKRQRTDGSENSQDSVKSNVSSQEENRQVESPSIPATPSVGKVTSVTLGTPVIVTSPYLNLPSSEKFSKDICDVINFENLPDSTGKYEKMSGLIKKVRTFVTKLNSEEDDE